MSQGNRSEKSGITQSEYIRSLGTWLPDIGIGLGMIVDTARVDFNLNGTQLIEFVRLALKELVRLGARPRHIGSPDHPDRDIPLYYGENELSIVEGVIDDWVKMGMPDLEWGEFWFISPETTAIEMDKEWYRAP